MRSFSQYTVYHTECALLNSQKSRAETPHSVQCLQAFLPAELLIEDHLEPRKEQSHGRYDRWKVGQRCDYPERRARSFYPRGLQVSPLDRAGWQTGTFWRGRIRSGSESLSSIRVAVLSVGTSDDHHAHVEA